MRERTSSGSSHVQRAVIFALLCCNWSPSLTPLPAPVTAVICMRSNAARTVQKAAAAHTRSTTTIPIHVQETRCSANSHTPPTHHQPGRPHSCWPVIFSNLASMCRPYGILRRLGTYRLMRCSRLAICSSSSTSISRCMT